MNKPANSNGYRFVGKQRKRKLRRRGDCVFYDYASGFFVWRSSWTVEQMRDTNFVLTGA